MTEHKHNLNGYKRHKCRCETCTEAYSQYRIQVRLKSRKTPIRHHMVDAAPLIELYKDIHNMGGTAGRLIKRWQKEGVSIYDADNYCMKIGFHPIEVFGASYFEGLADEEEQYRQIYGELADV